jgi:hypothetical protein
MGGVRLGNEPGTPSDPNCKPIADRAVGELVYMYARKRVRFFSGRNSASLTGLFPAGERLLHGTLNRRSITPRRTSGLRRASYNLA